MSTSADANESVLAVVDKSSANQLELENAASQLLFGRNLNLLPSAFTTSSRVSIERKPSLDERGQPLNGRELNPGVIVFSLWKQGEQCWLKRDDTGKRVLLNGVACKPE